MPRYFKREGRGKGYEDVTREVAALRALVDRIEYEHAVPCGKSAPHWCADIDCCEACQTGEAIAETVQAYRAARSEQERCECVPAVDEDGAPDGYEYVCNLHEKASEREASDAPA